MQSLTFTSSMLASRHWSVHFLVQFNSHSNYEVGDIFIIPISQMKNLE